MAEVFRSLAIHEANHSGRSRSARQLGKRPEDRLERGPFSLFHQPVCLLDQTLDGVAFFATCRFADRLKDLLQ
jgi:hypothetical protein